MWVIINVIDFTTHQNPPWILTSRLKPAGLEYRSRESRGGGTDQSGTPAGIKAKNCEKPNSGHGRKGWKQVLDLWQIYEGEWTRFNEWFDTGSQQKVRIADYHVHTDFVGGGRQRAAAPVVIVCTNLYHTQFLSKGEKLTVSFGSRQVFMKIKVCHMGVNFSWIVLPTHCYLFRCVLRETCSWVTFILIWKPTLELIAVCFLKIPYFWAYQQFWIEKISPHPSSSNKFMRWGKRFEYLLYNMKILGGNSFFPLRFERYFIVYLNCKISSFKSDMWALLHKKLTMPASRNNIPTNKDLSRGHGCALYFLIKLKKKNHKPSLASINIQTKPVSWVL